jgi:class 3 adenylate cyclase
MASGIENEDADAMYRERVSAHELRGAKREAYMKQMWSAFSSMSLKGVVTKMEAKHIADINNVDGEERYITEQGGHEVFTFKQLIQVCDDMSKASGNEYQDVDVERAEMATYIEYLGLCEYLGRCCSSSDDGDDEAKVEYRLQVMKDVNLTPKTLLMMLLATLLLFTSAVLIVGLHLSWLEGYAEVLTTDFTALHRGLTVSTDYAEQHMLQRSAESTAKTAALIAAWTGHYADSTMAQARSHGGAVAQRLSTLVTDIGTDPLADALPGRAALLADLAAVDEFPAVPDAALSFALSGFAPPRAVMFLAACPNGIPQANGTVACPTQLPPSLNFTAAAAVVDELNALPSANSNIVVLTTPTGAVVSQHSAQNCRTAQDDAVNYCSAFASATNLSTSTTGVFQAFGGAEYVTGIAAFAGTGSLLSASPLADAQARTRSNIIAMANTCNSAANVKDEVEIVIATQDAATLAVNAQASTMLRQDSCVAQCERSGPSTESASRAFGPTTPTSGWTLQPNYQPAATVSAFAAVGHGTGSAIVLERPVETVRSRSFAALAEILDSVNAVVDGIHASFAGRNTTARMPTFDPSIPCPAGSDCIVGNRTTGVLYQLQCRDCQPAVALSVEESTADLYEFTTPASCNDPANCNRQVASVPTRVALQEQQSSVVFETDETIDVVGFIRTLNTALRLSVSKNNANAALNDKMLGSILGSVAVLIVGVLLVIAIGVGLFGKLEEEWTTYQRQHDRDKSKTSALIKGIIPPAISERLMYNNSVIYEHVSVAGFVFVDVCGFTDVTKLWSARQTARYMVYLTYMMDEVCAHSDVFRLRTIGDMFTTVALRDNAHSDAEFHPVRRSMNFASIVMLLFSKFYVHHPHNMRVFREVFKDKLRDGSATEMPDIRIGVHCGPTIMGAYNIGNVAHYDFYGTSPALANRMQQTALPNRIHVTLMVREMLRTRDPKCLYLFEGSRKTVVRGHGTLTSYFVRAVTETVPPAVMRALNVNFSRQRHEFLHKVNTNAQMSLSDQSMSMVSDTPMQ